MRIFISYSRNDGVTAEQIALALREDGHRVFFDLTELSEGNQYHRQIRNQIRDCELFVFLVSTASLQSGSYAAAELEIAKRRWKHPDGWILPVVLDNSPNLPPYLEAVTYLRPKGNIAAETAARVSEISPRRSREFVVRNTTFLLSAIFAAAAARWTPVNNSENLWNPLSIALIAAISLFSLWAIWARQFISTRRLAFQIILGTFSVAFFAIISSASLHRAKPLLATSKWIGFAPFYIASLHGQLPGWELNSNLGVSREERKRIVSSGRTAVFTGTLEEMLVDQAHELIDDMDSIVVLRLARSEGGDAVLAANGITEIGQLQGRRVGAWSGGTEVDPNVWTPKHQNQVSFSRACHSCFSLWLRCFAELIYPSNSPAVPPGGSPGGATGRRDGCPAQLPHAHFAGVAP